MFRVNKLHFVVGLLSFVILLCASGPTAAAVRIEGLAQGGGGPLANSTVTLWAASTAQPRQLAQARSDSDGRFELASQETPGADTILYLVAKGGTPAVNKGGGDNPAIALLSVLGNAPPSKVVVNEMTTVAAVWTHAQFLDGDAIKGNPLGLKIAAGNVPNFVNVETGAWGEAILGPLNGARRRRWPISPRWLTCSPVALCGSPPRPAPNCSSPRRRPRAASRPTR